MDIGTKIKTCTKCSDTKSINDFRKEKKGKYGVMSVCKIRQSKIEKENLNYGWFPKDKLPSPLYP